MEILTDNYKIHNKIINFDSELFVYPKYNNYFLIKNNNFEHAIQFNNN